MWRRGRACRSRRGTAGRCTPWRSTPTARWPGLWASTRTVRGRVGRGGVLAWRGAADPRVWRAAGRAPSSAACAPGAVPPRAGCLRVLPARAAAAAAAQAACGTAARGARRSCCRGMCARCWLSTLLQTATTSRRVRRHAQRARARATRGTRAPASTSRAGCVWGGGGEGCAAQRVCHTPRAGGVALQPAHGHVCVCVCAAAVCCGMPRASLLQAATTTP
jgi:hypothetical protein